MQDEYSNPTLRLWRRTEDRFFSRGRLPAGYIFEGYDVGNDLVQEACSLNMHALSKLEPAATPDQHAALVRKFGQQNEVSRPEFMSRVQSTVGMDDAVVVPWAGMWLVAETDGYTHS